MTQAPVSPFRRGLQPVSTDGYAWILDQRVEDGRDLSRLSDGAARIPILVALKGQRPAPNPYEAPTHYVEPMKEPGLHRTFAETKPSLEGIAEFSLRRGLLGRQLARFTADVERRPELLLLYANGIDVRGETFDFWHHHITKVRELLRLHRALLGESVIQDLAALGRERPVAKTAWIDPFGWLRAEAPRWLRTILLHGTRAKWVSTCPYDLRLELARAMGLDESVGTIEPGVAWEFLHREINDEVYEGVRTSVVKTRAGLTFLPCDLLGAIYAHLAMEVTGQTPCLVRCPECGGWFEQSHRRQRYCEEKCKAKAYRKRKKSEE